MVLAEATIWDEGVFSLNQGFLEKLLSTLSDFDFAVLIWAADDVTESKGESRASPRDNVVFECGLFMGAVGRERVFIVCDQSISLKIPSDLLGLTLATYDGSRIGADDSQAAVRMACDLIARDSTAPIPDNSGRMEIQIRSVRGARPRRSY
jgi:predicted nucleotide-binding protein